MQGCCSLGSRLVGFLSCCQSPLLGGGKRFVVLVLDICLLCLGLGVGNGLSSLLGIVTRNSGCCSCWLSILGNWSSLDLILGDLSFVLGSLDLLVSLVHLGGILLFGINNVLDSVSQTIDILTNLLVSTGFSLLSAHGNHLGWHTSNLLNGLFLLKSGMMKISMLGSHVLDDMLLVLSLDIGSSDVRCLSDLVLLVSHESHSSLVLLLSGLLLDGLLG